MVTGQVNDRGKGTPQWVATLLWAQGGIASQSLHRPARHTVPGRVGWQVRVGSAEGRTRKADGARASAERSDRRGST